MKIKQAKRACGLVDICTYESSKATVQIIGDLAVIQMINSKKEGLGHGTSLMLQMKEHYEKLGKELVGNSPKVPISQSSVHIKYKLGIRTINLYNK